MGISGLCPRRFVKVDPVPRLWPGSTIVCIGTGPSVTQADVDVVRGKARVIAINDAHRLAPWADVLYSCDGQWVDWHHGVTGFQGLKYSMTVNRKKWPDWKVVRNGGEKGLSLDPSSVCTGRNSGYQAINLAVHLGAKRIVLLGYDMSRDPAQRKSHFFGEHPKRPKPSPYSQFLLLFETIKKPLARVGVEVVNCTRRTMLDCFPKRSLEDVFVTELQEAV